MTRTGSNLCLAEIYVESVQGKCYNCSMSQEWHHFAPATPSTPLRKYRVLLYKKCNVAIVWLKLVEAGRRKQVRTHRKEATRKFEVDIRGGVLGSQSTEQKERSRSVFRDRLEPTKIPRRETVYKSPWLSHFFCQV